MGKKVKRGRAKGLLPAVVYGHGFESKPLYLDAKIFSQVFQSAGTSALVDLQIDDQKPVKVLIHEPQMHYLKGQPIHADMYAVKMTEKIETAIPIHFLGESPAVEELEGNLNTSKDELEIRCLPADLIPAIEVDISVLKTFDDSIHVSDIKVPSTIEIMHEPDELIASVAAPISEEKLAEELAGDTSEAETAAVEELGKEADGETAEAESAEK